MSKVSKIIICVMVALLTGIFWGMSFPGQLPVWTIYLSYVWTIPYAIFIGKFLALVDFEDGNMR